MRAFGQTSSTSREDALHRVDRAQRHEEAARPLRLLADDAVPERDALVEDTRSEAAGTIARENRVAVGKPGSPIRRGLDREVETARPGHALGKPANQVESLRVQVDEHDLGALEVLALVDEARHRAGAARGAAADIRHLDACHLKPSPGSKPSAGRERGARPSGASSAASSGRGKSLAISLARPSAAAAFAASMISSA